jgi:hypothetical protein
MAQLADGYKGGRIASQVLPNGTRDIIRRQGDKQVEGMIDLESRLEAARDIWPEAETEQQAVAERRTAYQDVLVARSDKQREIRAALAARDAAKERFLDTYVEIANLVKAEFPRDRRHADLFFDTVRVRSRDEQEEEDDDTPDEPDTEPAEQSAE